MSFFPPSLKNHLFQCTIPGTTFLKNRLTFLPSSPRSDSISLSARFYSHAGFWWDALESFLLPLVPSGGLSAVGAGSDCESSEAQAIWRQIPGPAS